MKTTIYYFSGTGNSLKVARDLAALLGDTELVFIPSALKNNYFPPTGRLVIIYPVYMWGQPLIVSRFIDHLPQPKAGYVFSIATYGMVAGSALKQTSRELDKKGYKLSSAFALRMPGNYTPLYGAPGKDKQEKLFQKARLRIKEIAQIVREGKGRPPETSSFCITPGLTNFIYKMGSKQIPGADKDFWIKETCNHCGIYARVCPVNNIILQEGKPIWRHHCEQCLSCLQWCPQETIQLGKRTPHRKRYHHPEVSIADFIQENK